MILEAHRRLDKNNSDLETITDDASLIEKLSDINGVRVVEPEKQNMKITTPEDLRLFELYLKAEKKEETSDKEK